MSQQQLTVTDFTPSHFESVSFYECPSNERKTASYALDVVIGAVAAPLFASASGLALPLLAIGTGALVILSSSLSKAHLLNTNYGRAETLKKVLIIAAAYCISTTTAPTLLIAGIIGKIALTVFTLTAFSLIERKEKDWEYKPSKKGSDNNNNNNNNSTVMPCITRVNFATPVEEYMNDDDRHSRIGICPDDDQSNNNADQFDSLGVSSHPSSQPQIRNYSPTSYPQDNNEPSLHESTDAKGKCFISYRGKKYLLEGSNKDTAYHVRGSRYLQNNKENPLLNRYGDIEVIANSGTHKYILSLQGKGCAVKVKNDFTTGIAKIFLNIFA